MGKLHWLRSIWSMSTLPDYQKMQVKTARYHFIPIRLAKIRNLDNIMVSKENTHWFTLMRCHTTALSKIRHKGVLLPRHLHPRSRADKFFPGLCMRQPQCMWLRQQLRKMWWNAKRQLEPRTRYIRSHLDDFKTVLSGKEETEVYNAISFVWMTNTSTLRTAAYINGMSNPLEFLLKWVEIGNKIGPKKKKKRGKIYKSPLKELQNLCSTNQVVQLTKPCAPQV